MFECNNAGSYTTVLKRDYIKCGSSTVVLGTSLSIRDCDTCAPLFYAGGEEGNSIHGHCGDFESFDSQ